MLKDLFTPDVPDFLDPQQIESITLLRSMSATNRYGSQGRGGVFLVKLKSLARKTKRLLNTLVVKGNDYTEQIYSVDLDSLIPYYIKDYKNANSVTEAKNILKLQKTYTSFQYLFTLNLIIILKVG